MTNKDNKTSTKRFVKYSAMRLKRKYIVLLIIILFKDMPVYK